MIANVTEQGLQAFASSRTLADQQAAAELAMVKAATPVIEVTQGGRCAGSAGGGVRAAHLPADL